MCRLICLVVLPLTLAFAASADEVAGPGVVEPAYAAIELAAVLEAVSNDTGKTFVVDAGIDGLIFAGALSPRDVDMATLHTLLFANGLAAVEKDQFVRILSTGRIRQQALPLLGENEGDFAADEWVTHPVRVTNVKAGMLVPILRPLVPQQGHLVAHQASNTLILIGRYSNVQRIRTLIRMLDRNSEPE